MNAADPAILPRREVLGVVLAGGRSQRMRTDKADLADHHGNSLAVRALATLADVVEHIAVSGRLDDWVDDLTSFAAAGRAKRWTERCFALPDPEPFQGHGPLAGLLAAMEAAPQRGCSSILVIPVDMPDIDSEALQRLLTEHDRHDDVAVVAMIDRLQPLVGCYPAALSEIVREALQQRRRSVHQWLDSIDYREVRLRDSLASNLNHPHEYDNWLNR